MIVSNILRTANATYSDLSTPFYLTKADIGKNRALVRVGKLAKPNPYVDVKAITSELTKELISQYKVVVLVNANEEESVRVSKLARESKVKFILEEAHGLVSLVFVDFGAEHVITDLDGEQPRLSVVHLITQGNAVVVRVIHTKLQGLTNEDYAVFSQVGGMTEINDLPPANVKFITPISFSVSIDATLFHEYAGSSHIHQVKMPSNISSKTFLEVLKKPNFANVDFLHFSRASSLHAAYAALHQFCKAHEGLFPTHTTRFMQQRWQVQVERYLRSCSRDRSLKKRLSMYLH
jgi:hypothetical protein